MWARFKGTGDPATGRIANPELIFIDVGVVNTIDGQPAQDFIVHEYVAFVMLESKGFEKILIDDDSAGGNDGVDHVIANEVDHDLFQTGGNEGPGEAENNGALIIAQHCIINLRGPAEIAGGKRHL